MKSLLRRISRFPLAFAVGGVVLLVAPAVLSAEGQVGRQPPALLSETTR